MAWGNLAGCRTETRTNQNSKVSFAYINAIANSYFVSAASTTRQEETTSEVTIAISSSSSNLDIAKGDTY